MRVPVVNAPSVGQDPLRIPALQLGVGPDAFGAGIARGLGAIGEQADQIAQEEKRKADSATVFDASSVAADAMNAAMTELTSRKLHEAEGVTLEATKRFQEIRTAALEQGTNETQKTLIQRVVTQQAVAHLETARNHEATERDRFRVFGAEQMVRASQQAVTVDPLNEEMAWVAKQNAAAAIKNQYGDAVTPEQLIGLKEAAVSSVARARLNTLLANGRNSEFLALYQTVKDDLRGDDALKMAVVATTTTDLAKAFEVSDAAWQRSGGDEGKALASAATITDAKLRNDVEDRIRQRAADVQAVDRHDQEVDLDAAWGVYVKRGSPDAMPLDLYSRILAKNPLAIKAMRDDMLVKTRAAAGQEFKPTLADRKIYGDWLMTPDAQKPDPRTVLAGHVTPGEFDHAFEIMRSIQNKDEKAKGLPFPRGTLDGLIKIAAGHGKRAVIKPEDYADFHTYVWNRFDELGETLGSKATRKDLQAVIDEALISGEILSGHWYTPDPDARKFQAAPGESFRPFNSSDAAPIPAGDLAQIDAAILSRGGTPNDELRRRMYAAAHATDGGPGVLSRAKAAAVLGIDAGFATFGSVISAQVPFPIEAASPPEAVPAAARESIIERLKRADIPVREETILQMYYYDQSVKGRRLDGLTP